jgi:hypothetical protein
VPRALIIVILIVLLAVGAFFASPLFYDRTVNEEFDIFLPSGGLDMAAVMAMPEEKRVSMKDEIMDAAAKTPDTAADEAMPEVAPTQVARGEFRDADGVHKGSGNAIVYRLPDGRHVVRFEDFRTTNGPALVVYLAKHPDPASAGDVTDGGFLDLGKLKGNVGNQNYVIPTETDISGYGSIVIWCELFDVLFSPASLQTL